MADKFYNRNTQVSFEQIATGSYPTAATAMGTARYLGHNVKHTINDTNNKIERLPCTSANKNVKGYFLGVRDLKNSLEWQPIHFAMFANAIGECTSAGSETYTHVIAEETQPYLPPFNIEHTLIGTANEARVYNGCTVDTLTLEADGAGAAGGGQSSALKMSMDYAATYVYTAGAIESLTEDTTQPYMWHETRILLDIANSGAYTSGTELTELQKFSFSVKNNLKTEPRCGSTTGGGYNSRPFSTKREYELVLDWDMSNDDYYDLGLADTEIAYQIYVYRGAADYFKLTVEDAQILTAPDPIDAEGDQITQTITVGGGALDATGANNTSSDAYSEGTIWMADTA